MISPLGMRACFVPPSSRAGAISAQTMMDKVEAKTRAYRRLAETHGVPLIVAVGAHRFMGVTLADVDDILRGLAAPKIKFQFDAGDSYVGTQTVSCTPVPPWEWPQGLAGLLWISNECRSVSPPARTRRAMPAAFGTPRHNRAISTATTYQLTSTAAERTGTVPTRRYALRPSRQARQSVPRANEWSGCVPRA